MKARARKKKFLVVSYDFPPKLGGIATCAHKLCKALEEQPGVEIRVLTARHSGYESFDSRQTYTIIRPRFCRRPRFAAFGLALRMLWEFATWRPHAVISLHWFPDGLASFLATKLSFGRIPYFVFAHGVEVLESENSPWRRLRKRLSFLKSTIYRRARTTFAVSGFTRNLVADTCAVPAEKIHVVNNGVNCFEFFPAEKPRDLIEKFATHGKYVFLSVSRLYDYKGMDQAILAVNRLRRNFPEILYLIGGTGPDQARLQELVKELGLEAHVQFTGAIRQDDLARFYNLADCFVLLSRDDRVTPNVEGFGIVFLEAAACAKPVIAGQSGGIADAVAHDYSGWLVDPLDPEKIAAYMERLLRDPELSRQLGRNGRMRAETQFTWGHAGAKVYESVSSHVRN